MRTGFTLIELLVVVTIIVILIALLVPAMDRAIYQAELAVCGAQLKTIGTGVTAYATNSKGVYPRFSTGIQQPAQITTDRPFLRKAFGSLKPFACPLAGKLDLDTAANVNFYSGYNLFLGFNYLGQKGMRRLGQSWTSLANVDASGTVRVREFNTIAGDRDLIFGPNAAGVVQSSHPDRGNVTHNVVAQDSTNGNGYAGGNWTIAWWLNTQSLVRGFNDDNFVQTDGSVLRISNLASDDRTDGRVSKVPIFVGEATFRQPFEGIFVPRGN